MVQRLHHVIIGQIAHLIGRIAPLPVGVGDTDDIVILPEQVEHVLLMVEVLDKRIVEP